MQKRLQGLGTNECNFYEGTLKIAKCFYHEKFLVLLFVAHFLPTVATNDSYCAPPQPMNTNFGKITTCIPVAPFRDNNRVNVQQSVATLDVC